MNNEQPKPESKNYGDLINDTEKGIIKIPKFQRDFVWDVDKTAKLLDSILKGYPIGTFILWQTDERINNIKKIGNLELPDTPEGTKVQYVLDGQQRITSLFAAYRGAEILRPGKKKPTDYKDIFVNLDRDVNDDDGQVITAGSKSKSGKSIPLHDVLNFGVGKWKELSDTFNEEELDLIDKYSKAFGTYQFSTVVLRKEDIDSAIEVFTRINTGGQTLTLFEIMSAKTYDEKQNFDMQAKWKDFTEELKVKDIQYENVSSIVILNLISLVLTKECKRKAILTLDKQKIINIWDEAIDSIKTSIDYFRRIYRIPVSQLLPYDILLVPFAYFFFQSKKERPEADQQKCLEEFFWRMSLSYRYTSTTESKLAQDIKRIDQICGGERPDYAGIPVQLATPEDLINKDFRTGDSYCKAVLCLLAYQEPKDFQDNGKVLLDNSWLKISSSKNYHHFFPKKHLKDKGVENRNSLVNITLVSEHLNKRKIASRAPSDYIRGFKDENNGINKTLNSHFIDLDGFGIESDDYGIFLQARAKRMFDELQERVNLRRKIPDDEEMRKMIAAGEGDTVEFKSTLRYDLQAGAVNEKLRYVIAKTIAAFLNSNGGDLFIGVDDDGNAMGLERDIGTLKKKDQDGFSQQITGIVEKYIGFEHSSHIKVMFPVYNDIKICRVRIEKSSRPVFIKHEGQEYFFIRSGGSSQPLSREEQSSYEKEHWGG